eukprot:CAMPEP_0113583556 /NCGR_PEP_ID=MMETSP0015_2-20120614/32588_1 /TAXON_ID=2838 /ORGANISM="Odontella" /LENGTH=595 /DNA_ID=CAMNT_0000488457 /DNA_START=118 /DNA_END=1905 /DNA_ORIENTATION=+ /assembly_acc=CAM_ASM_000160
MASDGTASPLIQEEGETEELEREECSAGEGSRVLTEDDNDPPARTPRPWQSAAPPDEPAFLQSIVSSSDQITAMLSNFATNYNVVNISLVLPILQSPSLYKDSVTEETDSLCASSCLAGMVIGQLAGGALGDVIGRMNAMYIVIILQIVASLSSALLVWDGVGLIGEWNVFDKLAAWRFLLGVGAGGVYPLAAVLSAEQDLKEKSRNGMSLRHTDSMEMQRMNDRKLRMIAITFSMQGVGFLTVPLLTYPLLSVMGESNLDVVWRIVLGLGAFPGLALILLRWKDQRRSRHRHDPVPVCPPEMLEPKLTFRAASVTADGAVVNSGDLQIGGIEAGENEEPLLDDHIEEDHNDHTEVPYQGLWSSIKHEKKLVKKLCGTAGSWMLFDILFYGNTLFQPIVLEAAFGRSGEGTDEGDHFALLLKATRDALVLYAIALPGYFVSTFVMGRRTCRVVHQTPRFIQIQGFLLMAILYAIVGAYWKELKTVQWLLVLLYGGTFFFANYGPNTTTFMLPSITFSPACRSSLNGISAASGKVGALLGATLFEPMVDSLGDDRVMLLCAFVAILALLLTLVCVTPEKKAAATASVNQVNRDVDE